MPILIVDDSRTHRQLLRQLLSDEGYRDLDEVHSGSEAIARAASSMDLDLVLLDIIMPDMDGIEVCRVLKSYPHLVDVPVIIITVRDDMECLRKAFAAGAVDYITKPPQPVELAARVGACLRLKREMDRRKTRERELLDLTERLAASNQMLQRLAVVDALTSVANRRYFDQVLEQEWRRCLREKLPLGLALLDIDLFKAYNDHYGHQAGDYCLIQVAQTLQGCCRRPGDTFARYGGEEFAIIMANTPITGVYDVAERAREALGSLRLPHAQDPCGQVTVSAGCASLIPRRALKPADLLRAADQALYQAKQNGRNRACMSEMQA